MLRRAAACCGSSHQQAPKSGAAACCGMLQPLVPAHACGQGMCSASTQEGCPECNLELHGDVHCFSLATVKKGVFTGPDLSLSLCNTPPCLSTHNMPVSVR